MRWKGRRKGGGCGREGGGIRREGLGGGREGGEGGVGLMEIVMMRRKKEIKRRIDMAEKESRRKGELE